MNAECTYNLQFLIKKSAIIYIALNAIQLILWMSCPEKKTVVGKDGAYQFEDKDDSEFLNTCYKETNRFL